MAKIYYTITDEAPALATASFLPIIQAFTRNAGIEVETKDISLAARILGVFPEYLTEEQRISNDLEFLGNLATNPEANIIKLPNISASIPQLEGAIKELQTKGYAVPDYPAEPKSDEEKSIRSRYDKIKGSAVNPVLREGNSDRRAPIPVKNYAKKHPHSMGPWSKDSKSKVATMSSGDFKSNEKSTTLTHATAVGIKWVGKSGTTEILKDKLAVQVGEIIDATVMEKSALLKFLNEQVQVAKREGILFSVHLKATMMKVSDPIIFGHVVRSFFKTIFEKYGAELEAAGIHANNGLESLFANLHLIPEAKAEAIRQELKSEMEQGPALAMVNSDKGITNLHVPSDVIIDASMPAMIRNSGRMWDVQGNSRDTLAVIPDSSYAGVYAATIDFCKEHGAFDPRTMGTVPNVGLMAQKAEEYGSHDKTFEIKDAGSVQVYDIESGAILLEHHVEPGDIWRMCQVKDAPIRNWIELAVERAKVSQTPAIFWLDPQRAHDRELIKKVDAYLPQATRSSLNIQILSPIEATNYTLVRLKEGKDTISVTGNVLRDYLTDLFPILEVGTSAKMLSIVPLMNGGGLFETGAGGSAPKHVEQFLEEGHLRWDSLGEFMALAVSLEFFGRKNQSEKARILGTALDQATEVFLDENRSPGRKAGELDTRGSHFYMALYWAEALAHQSEDAELAQSFGSLAKSLRKNENKIVQDLLDTAGKSQDIGGYYLPDSKKLNHALRPSTAFNESLGQLS